MKKLIGVGSTALIVAIALAAGVVVGAKGHGQATNAAGQRAEFNLDAWKKASDNAQTHVGGYLKFVAFSGTNSNPVSHSIYLPAVQKLAKAGKVCEFGGRAKMQIRHGNFTKTVEGNCFARVEDLRDPMNAGMQMDKVRVRFTSAAAANAYEWAGLVNQGDIVVYEKHFD